MQQNINSNIFLNASAGSGKTFALCVRYIALLFQGAHANEILTLTFTKKAANEMKERITNNLFLLYITCNQHSNTSNNLLQKNQEYTKILQAKDDLLQALESYNLNSHDIHTKISHVYKQFLQADKKIGTIDSFFTSILRKFAFFVGIRRDFNIQERYINDEVFIHFLTNTLHNKNMRQILQSLLQDLELPLEAPFTNNTLTLKSLLTTLYQKHIDFKDPADFHNTMLPDCRIPKLQHLLQNLSLDIKNLSLSQIKDEIIKNARILSQYLKDIAPTKPNKNLDSLYKNLESNNINTILHHKLILDKQHHYIKQSIKPDYTAEQEIFKFCLRIYELGMLYYMLLENEQLFHIYLLFESYKQSLQDIETKTNTLTFDSLGHKVFAITTDTLCQQNTFQSDYFYFRLDGTISHILFDEYQDTSRMQYRIFLPIFEEILGGSGTKDSKTLFFVGDSKQSLYGFRGASLHVFEATKAKQSLLQKTLQHNYRSKKNIIDFVNTKFSPIFKENYENQIYSNQALNHEGIINVKLYKSNETENNKQITQDLKESAFIDILYQLEKLFNQNIEKKDIAILARKREILQEFIEFSKQKNCNIQFNLDKNGKLIQQRATQAIFYAIKVSEWNEKIKRYKQINKLQINNIDTINSSHQETIQTDHNNDTLMTYKIHLKFAQKKLNKLLGKSYFDDQHINIPYQKTLALTIKFVIEHFCLYNKDCMELLEIASANPELKNIDLLFDFLQDKESKLMQEEAVQAMTVHGSKGLGFEHVLYIELDEHKAKANNKILFDYDETGIFLNDIRLDNTKNYQDTFLQNLVKNTQEENIQQEYNTLYVACTRAKSGLYIFAHKNSHASTSLQLTQNDSCGNLNDLQITKPQKKQQNQIIISTLKNTKASQEEFLISPEEKLYQNSIAMQHKQIIGISLHLFLELLLEYKFANPLPIIRSQYGFYINEQELTNLLQKAQNIFHTKLQKTFDFNKNMIKCEISFLQENSIKRLDAIVQHDSGLLIIEFKSSQKISDILLQKHTIQLQSYMSFIHNIFQSTIQIKGYLVYLQDSVEVREITI